MPWLGFALLLKYFQQEARFPKDPSNILFRVVAFIAKQLLPHSHFRTITYVRVQFYCFCCIRAFSDRVNTSFS
ncbi:DUF4158 domain-containing protein [Geomicrobium sp. JCM 19039]|uniref:DUF4158 domain-containing protein n=1 Tax=Geomicrobium sp. JCM 19039 TaxID=1460636 RepID=UPI0009E0318A|nr:DUF4158 domain-containing protein [Geomicrobium sp. JCM 19039]